MSVDWQEGLSIAGKGIGTTFLVLIALAVISWLVGAVLQKVDTVRRRRSGTGEGEG